MIWRRVPLSVFAALVVFSSSAAEEGAYRFERMWPTLQQPWYFGNSAGVAVDAQGHVYVADASLERVQKFTRDGQLITQWGRDAAIPELALFAPHGIATDHDGFVYTIQHETVRKFTRDGQFIWKWVLFDYGDGTNFFVNDIAVDYQSNVYVTGHDFWIQKRCPDGELIVQWGGEGSGDGQFAHAGGIAIDDDGYVYVTDGVRRDLYYEGVEEFENNRVQVFTSEGVFVRAWGATGFGEGQFKEPRAIAIGPAGAVYVTDSLSRVQKFAPDGAFVTQWYGWSAGPTQFLEGVGLAVDRSGTVTLADGRYGRLLRYTADGRFLTVWSARSNAEGWFSEPYGVEQGPNGNLYVADSANRRVEVFSTDGRFLFQWGSPGSEAGEFDYPRSIAAAADGSVYVVDQKNHRVQKFSSAGDFLRMWGTEGTGLGQFRNPTGIEVDADGYVYVADSALCRIQKFTSEGAYVLAWGSRGSGDGEFYEAEDIAVAPDGTVYVTDWLNPIVQKFTSGGEFLESWWLWNGLASISGIDIDAEGNVYLAEWKNSRIEKYDADMNLIEVFSGKGSNPDQVSLPWGICVGQDGAVYVTDLDTHRVQKFQPVGIAGQSKAVIVAGGGAFPGNNLWDATQFCANFAYRALVHQGFTKESIYYLSSDLYLDLDGNGEQDDVDADATDENFEFALTQWAADAEDLVVYMVDHGGVGKFRMSGAETVSAQDLGRWLDQAEQAIWGSVILVYDACQSGSFLAELGAPGRIVIASATAEENAYFLSTGTISFSNFFWTQVFNGSSVLESFDVAAEAVGRTVEFQRPQLSDPSNQAAATFIGNGSVIQGDAPTIEQVSPPQTVAQGTSAEVFADASDEDGVARVWAVIRPPDYVPASLDNAVQSLPFVELQPGDGNRWAASYNGFTTQGSYQLAVYSRDAAGNTSLPALTTVSVANPLRRRAVLVAGGSQSDAGWPAVEASIRLAYEALRFQGYADDDMQCYSPVTFSAGVDGANVLSNIEYALTDWAAEQTRDLTVYLVGAGAAQSFCVNADETLTAGRLDDWLDALQENMPGVATLVYDADRSGSFLPLLTPAEGNERIVVASAGRDQTACQPPHQNISFSSYFWRRVLNGATVNTAFTHAGIAVAFGADGQNAQLDDNGDGVYDARTDGLLARTYTIGVGILLASDDPLVGEVSPEQNLEGTASATIWAEDVTSTGAIERVFAVIAFPEASNAKRDCSGPLVEVIELTQDGGRYRETFNGFRDEGTYDIAVVAVDTDGAASLPGRTTVTQSEPVVDPDAYEQDDSADWAALIFLDGSSQTHNFHCTDDEDWVRFYALADQIVTVQTENLGADNDTIVELYASDGSTLLGANDNRGPGDLSSYLLHTVTEEGFYYVRVTHAHAETYGSDSQYALHVLREAGPEIPGSLTGAVRDAQTGLAIESATVQTLGAHGTYTATGPRGEYIFPSLDAGSVSVRASKDGYEDSPYQTVIVLTGTFTKQDFDLVPIGEGVRPVGGCGSLDRATPRTRSAGNMLVLSAALFALLAQTSKRLLA